MSRLIEIFYRLFLPKLYCEKYGHEYIFDQAHRAEPYIFTNTKTNTRQRLLIITDPNPIPDEMLIIDEIQIEAENNFLLDNPHAIQLPRKRYIIGLRCKKCNRYISVPDDEYNPLFN